MENQEMFLFEIVVDKIFFNFGPIPQKKQIVIRVTCGTVLDLEIRTDVMGALEVHERDSKRMDVEVCCGRSILFLIKPNDLKELMNTCQIFVFVSTKLQTEPIGQVSLKWGQQFLKLVDMVINGDDNIQRVHSNDFYSLKKGNEAVGRIEIFHRLSYHGRNIDTQIELVEEEDETTGMMGRKFYFKGENNKTVYSCRKYGIGSDTDIMPVATIYKTIDHVIDIDLQNFFNMSMASLKGGSMSSLAPSVFNNMSRMFSLLSSRMSVADTMSMNKIAPGKLFMNIKSLMEENDEFSTFMGEVEDVNSKTITVEKIEKLLCNNPDCPAAKKFKDYGIGPLAKGKGLGGLYKKIEAHVTYGISQTKGNLQNYGPLGTLKKFTSQEKSKKSDDESISSDPLRLRGGSPEYFPDPQHECQDLMQQFNNVLGEFKNALGPCGEATCPFAHNLVDLNCQRLCNPKNLVPENCTIEQITTIPVRNSGDVSGCGVESCPYNREIITPRDAAFKKTQMRAACGSPQCPFTRGKLGLEECDDVHMPKVQCLENCPYGEKVELPPIHWDCPDPLPKGECQNPDCPIVRKEKLLEKYFPHPTSPCGSPTCPYSVVACTFPHCPFSVVEPCPSFCPYAKPLPKDLNCRSSVCPFAKPIEEICDVPDCPYKKKDEPDFCDNETCPYKNQETDVPEQKKCPCKEDEDKQSERKGSFCSVPECPYKTYEKGDIDKGETKKLSKGRSQSQTRTRNSSYSSKKSTKDSTVEDKFVESNKESSEKRAGMKRRRGRGRKKRRTGYVYDKGTYYPGNKIGHKDCVLPNFMVPPDMGWLWNVHTQCLQLRPRRGWKPGAISKTIADRINEHRKKYGLKPIQKVEEVRKGRRKHHRGGYDEDDSEENVQAKPTLQVKRKNGVVYVTMNPLKDPKTLEDNENPYMDCTPMQFKIVKNKPMKLCSCDEEVEGEDKEASEDSSELDIEFTPPAGVIRPERMKKKKNVCHVDVQYDVKDIPAPPKPEKGGKKGKKGKNKKKKK